MRGHDRPSEGLRPLWRVKPDLERDSDSRQHATQHKYLDHRHFPWPFGLDDDRVPGEIGRAQWTNVTGGSGPWLMRKFASALSVTTKQVSCCSTVQGGGKRRGSIIAPMLFPSRPGLAGALFRVGGQRASHALPRTSLWEVLST